MLKVLLKLSLLIVVCVMFGTYIYIYFGWSHSCCRFFSASIWVFSFLALSFWCMCFECLWWTRPKTLCFKQMPGVIPQRASSWGIMGSKEQLLVVIAAFKSHVSFPHFFPKQFTAQQNGATQKSQNSKWPSIFWDLWVDPCSNRDHSAGWLCKIETVV